MRTSAQKARPTRPTLTYIAPIRPCRRNNFPVGSTDKGCIGKGEVESSILSGSTMKRLGYLAAALPVGLPTYRELRTFWRTREARVRYMLFKGLEYYPCGGAHDLVGAYNAIEDAFAALDRDGGVLQWAHIYDREKREVHELKWFEDVQKWLIDDGPLPERARPAE